MPRYALITVTYNSAEALTRYWAEYVPQEDCDWIVVDNASTDSTAEAARMLGAKVVQLTKNIGFGRANNIGFAQTNAAFVGFVNPDVTVQLQDLQSLEAAAKRTRGVVAPQLVNPDGTLQPNGRGYPFLVYKILNRFRSNEFGDYRILSEVDDVPVVWLMGAAVFARRSIWEKLGPWDERFFVYYEDSDLGLRGRLSGVPSTLVGAVRWVHGWARETSTFSLRPWLLELTSMRIFYCRYPHLLSLMPRLTTRKLRLRDAERFHRLPHREVES